MTNGRALRAIGFSATAPGTGAAASAFSGDSLTITNSETPCKILAWWADQQVVGTQQYIWDSAHDTTRNIRVGVEPSEVDLLMPLNPPDVLYPQETVGVTIVGSATAGDVEQGCMLQYYEDFPGINANLIDTETLLRRVEKRVTVYGSITTTAGPGWTGAGLINSFGSDLLKANREYAIIGGKVETECLAVGIRAPDWGNLRVAFPGNDTDDTGLAMSFFKTLSSAYGLPTIPVFNASNKNDIRVDAAQDENAAAVPFTLILALLKSR